MARIVHAAWFGILPTVAVIGCSGGPIEARKGLADRHEWRVPVADSPPCAAPLGLDVVPVEDDRSGSTVVMARVHGRLLAYVADEDESAVRILDVEASDPTQVLGSVAVPGRPGRMLMLSGGRLAVTLTDRAKVAVYTPAAIGEEGLDLRCALETPDEPVDLAETPDHKTLLVTSDWGHALVAFDLDSGERRFDVDLPRAPRAVVASQDGARAYIAHAAGGAMSVVDLSASSPSARSIDVHGESTDPTVFGDMPRMHVGMCGDDVCGLSFRARSRRRNRSACQGFALAELRGAEPRVLSPMVEVATGDTSAPSNGYGPGDGLTPITAELPVVTVVDEAAGKTVKSSVVAIEPEGRGAKPPCLLPRAAVARHGSLYVACMGINAVVEYDATAEVPEAHERKRWGVGSGPTGLALHGRRMVVWSQFAGTVTILAPSADGSTKDSIEVVSVARRPRTGEEEEIALGRDLFHTSSDRRISSDGRACASCHPNARDDGLVWSTPGGPRQTPMLAGRLPDTAPYGWDGAGSDVSHHLDHTFARLEGEGLAPRDRAALVRYISTLVGPSVHATVPEALIHRGQTVFLSAGCASCHLAEEAWTDGQPHEVSSRNPGDAIAAFDTPSLRFVGGTAPYFHDGRYPTLRELLTRSDGPMGAARNMPAEDLDALETFVRSL